MAEIIKTWPANVDARTVAEMFCVEPIWGNYFFTLGRGKPAQSIERIWFTYRGRILGNFNVNKIVVNDGSLPHLHKLSDLESDWHIKPDMHVAICASGCERLKERVFMSGFRGYRYFNLSEYRSTPDARIRI